MDVLNIATVREHSANIPGIFRAGWVLFNFKIKIEFRIKFNLSLYLL